MSWARSRLAAAANARTVRAQRTQNRVPRRFADATIATKAAPAQTQNTARIASV